MPRRHKQVTFEGVREALDDARDAVTHARAVREQHRRRRRPDRQEALEGALQQLIDAHREIKSLVFAAVYREVPLERKVRLASMVIQVEKKKLYKMLHPEQA